MTSSTRVASVDAQQTGRQCSMVRTEYASAAAYRIGPRFSVGVRRHYIRIDSRRVDVGLVDDSATTRHESHRDTDHEQANQHVRWTAVRLAHAFATPSEGTSGRILTGDHT